MRVLVGWNLEREPLVHRVEPGETIKFGAHDFEHRDAAVVGEVQYLFDAIIHFDPGRDVERGRRDPGAKGLEYRVAAGHDLGLVRALVSAARPGVLGGAAARCCTRPPAGGFIALRRGLALACRMIGAVFGLGCRLFALERLSSLAARADLFAFAPLAHGAGATLALPCGVLHKITLLTVQRSNVCRSANLQP